MGYNSFVLVASITLFVGLAFAGIPITLAFWGTIAVLAIVFAVEFLFRPRR